MPNEDEQPRGAEVASAPLAGEEREGEDRHMPVRKVDIAWNESLKALVDEAKRLYGGNINRVTSASGKNGRWLNKERWKFQNDPDYPVWRKLRLEKEGVIWRRKLTREQHLSYVAQNARIKAAGYAPHRSGKGTGKVFGHCDVMVRLSTRKMLEQEAQCRHMRMITLIREILTAPPRQVYLKPLPHEPLVRVRLAYDDITLLRQCAECEGVDVIDMLADEMLRMQLSVYLRYEKPEG